MSQPTRPAWVRLVDHPVVVRTPHGTTGGLSFEGASPYLIGADRDRFLGALRRDVCACDIVPASKTAGPVDRTSGAIAPETCTPYVDATALGFHLTNVLPLVFVRTRRGEVLPNARVALKYLRENQAMFADVLETLAAHAPVIFEPTVYQQLRQRNPVLFSDVAQPYAAFSNVHMAMGAGCYVMTPTDVATVVGPLVNRPSVLPVHSGLMESEYHHSELFLVFDVPDFDGRVLLIPPGTPLGQVFFVNAAAHHETEIRLSATDLGADPAYRERSLQVGLAMVEGNRPFVLSTMTGVMSLSVSCPHCWVSVTAAAETGVPEDHVNVQDFYRGYKALRAEYRQDRPHNARRR